MSWSFLRCLLATAVVIAGAREVRSDLASANRLYEQSVAQITRASKLERRGKEKEAVEAYELAGQLCEGSLSEAQQTGLPEGERPPDVYYRCATSFLHAGRLLAQSRKAGPRMDENLRKAETYLDMVDKIEMARAQQTNQPINPETWRVRNAAGYVSFLQGELAQARLHYQAVLAMNPTYRPAEQAIREINKIEQRENELFTPQGRTLEKEKRKKLLRDVVDALDLVRDIITLGR